jgi:Uncharacterised nucleotidyltransferase
VLRLLDALRDPRVTRTWSAMDWDVAVRTARLARLLAVLADRVVAAGIENDLVEPVRAQLAGAAAESRYLMQMQRVELARATRVLAPLGIELVLLKGAAYVAQGLPIAAGRIPNDVDVLVDPKRLNEAEAALLAAGWRFEDDIDEYDQRYYRAWSHELPPLRYEGFVLELDLHHAILPPTTRASPPTALLLPQTRAIAGSPWRALAPADQVLHMAAHVFIDSDCRSRLRDLADIDALLRHYRDTEPDFMRALAHRTQALKLEPALAYALAFVRAWFVHEDDHAAALAELDAGVATRFRRSPAVLRLASRTLPPYHPDSEPSAPERWAARLLALRYHWWRMPLPLLVYHGAKKAQRALVLWARRPRSGPGEQEPGEPA